MFVLTNNAFFCLQSFGLYLIQDDKFVQICICIRGVGGKEYVGPLQNYWGGGGGGGGLPPPLPTPMRSLVSGVYIIRFTF